MVAANVILSDEQMMEQKALLYKRDFKSRYPVSVKPMLLLFCWAAMMSEGLFQNYLLFKTCDKYNFEESKCETELESEAAASQFSMFRSASMFFFWIFSTSFIGSLVDRDLTYLRWFLFFPAAGQLVCDLLNFWNVIYFEMSPLVLILSTLFVSGVSGSQIAALLLSTTYVSHSSSIEDRSIRIGYVLSAQVLGMALGNLSSGYVLKLFGLGAGFLLCVLLNGLGLFLGSIFIEDLSKRDIWVEKKHPHTFRTAVKDSFEVLTKKRPFNRRRMIILILVGCIFVQCYQIGETVILYLFLRNKFGWEACQYGVLMCYILCVKAAGTIFSAEVLKKRLRLRDATIGVIASLCEVVSHSLWFVTVQSWQIYLVPLFGLFERVIQLISMSLATKCVAPEEYGRLSSLFALTNLLLPVATLVYNIVFQYTLSSNPTDVFLMSVVLCLPLPFIFLCLLYDTKKIPPRELIRGEVDDEFHK